MTSATELPHTFLNRFTRLFLGIFLFFAFGASAVAQQGAVQPKPPVLSASEIDYPPFCLVDSTGRATGFSVELIRAALSAMGREVEFETGPWSEVRGLLERGDIQALPLVGRTPERESIFDFTFPYMSLHGVVVVRDETTGIRNLADLKGRQVAVMKSDNAEEFLRREDRGIRIVATPTFEDALRELSQGLHDAVVIQHLVALRLIQAMGLTNLRIVEPPIEGFRQDFCFAVREGDRETLALLNEGLALVIADGAYRRLHAKWFAALQLPSDRPVAIGGNHNNPPFEYLDEKGQPAGFTVELTRAIARETNMDIRIRLGSWTKIVADLENGEIDAIQGMFYSPERDRILDFSPPYLISHYTSVVRSGGKPPETIEELAGRSLVVQDGDVILEFLEEHGLESGALLAETPEDALRSVSEGSRDCALVPRISALHLIQKNGWTNLAVGDQGFFSGEYAYAATDGNPALLAQFSEGLQALKESGEYRRIYDKWMGVYQDSSPGLLTILRYVAIAGLPLLAMLLASVAWSWSLRKRVAIQTQALRDSMDRFKYVFEAANVGKSITRPTGEIDVNQAFADFLGYARDELKGKKWQELTPAEDIEPTETVLAQLLAGKKSAARFENRYLHKNGDILWGDVSAILRRDEHGNPLYFVTTVVDITDRRRTEQALHASEEFQRAMVACSPVALFTVDMDGIVLNWNSSAERIFGWRAEETIGRPLPIVPEGDREEFEDSRRQVFSGGGFSGKELIRMKKDGSTIPVSLSVTAVKNDRGETVGVMGAAEDITERKLSELRIEHLNNVLRAIREVNQLIVRERNRESLILEGCRLLVANRGYPSAMIVLTDEQDLPVSWALEGLAADSKEIAGIFEKGRLPFCCRGARDQKGVVLIRSRKGVCDGCPIIETCSENQSLCTPLIYEQKTFGYLAAAAENRFLVDEEELGLFGEMAGDFAYALGVMKIEEERRRGEAALRESESRFRLFAELAPVGIVISDEQENTLYASSKFTELVGYTVEDMPSIEEWWLLAYPDETLRSQVRKEWQAALDKAKTTRSEIAPLEYPVSCKDGSVRQIEFRAAATDRISVAIFTDITGRKRAEQEREKLQSQLTQAQKMESVGRLAGGVAHDYNNMLSVILGYTEMTMELFDEQDPVYVNLSEVFAAAQRSTDITRQLLAFARQQTVEPKLLDLNEAVESMLKMLRRLIGEDIDISWQPATGLWPIRIDPSQLDQILANLCVNARDAISDVGKIMIETDNVLFDEDYCADHAGFVRGEFVMLAVSDDGCGMDRETLGKIFEPFYTTKEVGKGTGLGLATVYGIAKQNDGFVNVYSEPLKGTTFRIYLPRHASETDHIEDRGTAEILYSRGETVLVVEDETSILKLSKKILEGLGYEVLEASAPGRAIDLARTHEGRIHLLITDVVMPEMNGRDLADQLKTYFPDLKTLFMSGYTANVIAHRGVLDEGVHFIQKPFSKTDLAVKARKALGD